MIIPAELVIIPAELVIVPAELVRGDRFACEALLLVCLQNFDWPLHQYYITFKNKIMITQKKIQKQSHYCFRSILLLFFTSCHFILVGQYANAPKVQWATSVDIPKKSTLHEEDWALAVIETEAGNFLSVGFSQGVVSSNVLAPERRLPAWVMLDPNGKPIADGIIDFGLSSRNGLFFELVEGKDGFYFIGKKTISNAQGAPPMIALAKINKTTLALEFAKTIQISSFAVNGFGKGIDIAHDQNGNEIGLVICGFENTGTGSEGIIFKTDMAGNPTGAGGVYEHWIMSGANDLDDEIIACKILYNTNNTPESIVFTGYQSVQDYSFDHDQTNDPNDGIPTYYNSDGIIDFPGNSGLTRTITRIDNDVVVGKINYSNLNNGPDFLQAFNSGPVEGIAPAASDLFTAYPRTFTNEYGPGTPGRTFDNNDLNCEDYDTNPTDPNCCYSETMDDKFALNSNDRGAKILISNTDGHIIISTWLNEFSIDGDPTLWRVHNNDPLLILGSEFDQDHSHEPVISDHCNGFDYTHYYDAECYLMKIDINDGSLLNAKHVAHLSGGDFNTPLRQEADGSFVVGGTTSDIGFTDLPDVSERFANFVIKTDPNFNISWRHHFVGQGDGNCLFGLTTTQDNGYVICGNTGDKDPVSGDEIENYSFVKLGPDCALDQVFDIDQEVYTLSQSETWTSDRKINSNVIVPPGRTLSINGSASPEGIEIEFAYSRLTRDFDNRIPVGITVEKGGVLKISKARLKGMDVCGGEQMWDGIMVKGNPNAPGPSASQGRMYMRQDSKIENAVIAVLLDEFSYEVDQVEIAGDESTGQTGFTCSTSRLKTFSNQGGAALQATDSEILNCRDGIVFHPMLYNNLSTLIDMRFVCNHTMLDENTFKEAGADGRLLGTRAFIRMIDVQNINLKQCSFTGYSTLDTDLRATGIESFGSRYSVIGSNGQNNPTEFKDLYRGIETFASELGAPDNSISLRNNNFTNVLNGVNLRSSTGTEIIENNFNEISASGGWGIYCTQSSVLDISFNNFSNSSSIGYYGLIVDQSSINGGIVHENFFDNLAWANQFQNDNAALTINCNTYENIGVNSWRVLEKAAGMGALADQGSNGSGVKKADNRYLDACTGTFPGEKKADILSYINFSYYDKAGNTDPADVNCVDSNVNFNLDPFDITTDDCDAFYTPPCPNPPCHTEDRVIYDNSPKGIKDRNRLLRTFLHWDSYAIPDSVYFIELDSISQLLASRTTAADKQLLVTTYLAKQDYSKADFALSLVNGSDPETNDFITYHQILIQAGLAGDPWYDLPSATLNNLLTYKNGSTSVAENAKALDYYYNGVYSKLSPLDIPASQYAAPESDQNLSVKAKTKVYPNPFKQEVIFEMADKKGYTIMVRDILGRLVWQYEVKAGTNRITWRPINLSSGTYLYQILSVDGQIEDGKILFVN